jgi:hypothetical protein
MASCTRPGEAADVRQVTLTDGDCCEPRHRLCAAVATGVTRSCELLFTTQARRLSCRYWLEEASRFGLLQRLREAAHGSSLNQRAAGGEATGINGSVCARLQVLCTSWELRPVVGCPAQHAQAGQARQPQSRAG